MWGQLVVPTHPHPERDEPHRAERHTVSRPDVLIHTRPDCRTGHGEGGQGQEGTDGTAPVPPPHPFSFAAQEAADQGVPQFPPLETVTEAPTVRLSDRPGPECHRPQPPVSTGPPQGHLRLAVGLGLTPYFICSFFKKEKKPLWNLRLRNWTYRRSTASVCKSRRGSEPAFRGGPQAT